MPVFFLCDSRKSPLHVELQWSFSRKKCFLWRLVKGAQCIPNKVFLFYKSSLPVIASAMMLRHIFHVGSFWNDRGQENEIFESRKSKNLSPTFPGKGAPSSIWLGGGPPRRRKKRGKQWLFPPPPPFPRSRKGGVRNKNKLKLSVKTGS